MRGNKLLIPSENGNVQIAMNTFTYSPRSDIINKSKKRKMINFGSYLSKSYR